MGRPSVSAPAAPSHGHVWPDSRGSHHGCRWSDVAMPWNPACWAATAWRSSSSGGKCSWEAEKKIRASLMPGTYPARAPGHRPLTISHNFLAPSRLTLALRAMEASALHGPAVGRRPLSIPLLRLRSDEQLVALFRSGSEDAFAAIHDRYRQRLFASVRQMMAAASRADSEDVLQDVFVRAYGALRADRRDVHLRAWLYRVAHNRCIDHLRRPTPPAGEVFEMSRTPLQDPMEAAQRRDDLKRLVVDVGR